jgi:hypothetical protein
VRGITGAQTSSGTAIYWKAINRFEKNRYRVGSPAGDRWYRLNAPLSQAEWKGFGHDRRDVFKPAAC